MWGDPPLVPATAAQMRLQNKPFLLAHEQEAQRPLMQEELCPAEANPGYTGRPHLKETEAYWRPGSCAPEDFALATVSSAD